MLWHASITPQWLAPLGEAVLRCVRRPDVLAGGDSDRDPQRWRSH